MSIENITSFRNCMLEPSWLQDLRKQAFDSIDQLELSAIERVTVGILGIDDHRKRGFCQCSRFWQPLIQI